MALSKEDQAAVRQIVREELRAVMCIEVLAKELAREIHAEQRRQELAAYDTTLDFDQMAKVQRAKMRELKRAKGGGN
ncbi:hypothetical protein KOM00_01950 [Geomonas sp. Red69]|uniref:hypothetical protein n=1 Tax=Geomonas diazotrophica TaxID=2843197 RepID=UPI001C107BFA|nr:hypothetical protein [Geomonas diazotrophica]MBU5635489.1 hypothetical protein [Geomonas diazotrophica]